MTTTAPSPEALAAAPNAIVISQFDVLIGDIADAKAKAADVTFDYADHKGNKAARSYIFDKRKLNARIESARTDAKAYALEYGRTVDSQAAKLKEQVAALIKPHQDAIDAIAKAEAERVARHRQVISGIKAYGNVGFCDTSEAIGYWLAEAKAVDIDGMEEFKEEAAAALLETIRTLEAAHTKALADEAAAAELAQLREQQRIQWQKDAEAKRIKDAEDAAAEAARKAQEEADAAAIAAVEESERKAAEAQARADAAEAALARRQAIDAARDQEEADKTVRAMHLEEMAFAVGEDPEPPATMPAQLTQSEHLVSPSARAVYRGRAAAIGPIPFLDLPLDLLTEAEAKVVRLRDEIAERMKPLSRIGVADALVDGTLHPAILIDWRLL